MTDLKVYGRIMTKVELKQVKRTNQLFSQEPRELVPAFDATFALAGLELSKSDIHILGKFLGSSGIGNILLLFTSEKEPLIKDVPFRNIDSIRRIIGNVIKEVKFENGTGIRIISIL